MIAYLFCRSTFERAAAFEKIELSVRDIVALLSDAYGLTR